MPLKKGVQGASREASPERGRLPIGTNPQNVKLLSWDNGLYRGRNPETLVGKYVTFASPINRELLVFEVIGLHRPIQVKSSIMSPRFKIEACPLLTEWLPKATSEEPLKIVAAASGKKQVAYAAPLCRKKRKLHGTMQIDRYNLIGLQFRGMEEMGWIWAEDLERSFEKGALKASVYIGEHHCTRKRHTPEEDEGGFEAKTETNSITEPNGNDLRSDKLSDKEASGKNGLKEEEDGSQEATDQEIELDDDDDTDGSIATTDIDTAELGSGPGLDNLNATAAPPRPVVAIASDSSLSDTTSISDIDMEWISAY
ncbi:hypothetical protein ABW21_db0201895 [Orbilia brochopaga]|nr:hypothetical protein ABW21_db0201895 [Drechslerella brochopaga]